MKILLTGGAGFIGSHIADALMTDPRVRALRVLDNFSTGFRENIHHHDGHPKFHLIEGDIRNFDTCLEASRDVQIICHQAALGSVPRSLADPLNTHSVNITGMLNILQAARENQVRRVVYAASSSTYGDSPTLPKQEHHIGAPLSPYAVTKYVNELYASVYKRNFGLEVVGLRYFNVFGPRQSPNGAYAAAIPLFIRKLMDGESPTIHGNGESSRDFTFVANAVQANLLAIFNENPDINGEVFNIACGKSATLLELFQTLKSLLGSDIDPVFGPERPGDIRHSLADISKARTLLGYQPEIMLKAGLAHTVAWFETLLQNNFQPE